MSSTLSFQPTQSVPKSLPYLGQNTWHPLLQLGLPKKPTLRQRWVYRTFLGCALGIQHLWKRWKGRKIGQREKLDYGAVSLDSSAKLLGNLEDGLIPQCCPRWWRGPPLSLQQGALNAAPQEGAWPCPRLVTTSGTTQKGLRTEGHCLQHPRRWGCEIFSLRKDLQVHRSESTEWTFFGFLYSFRKHLWHHFSGWGTDLWWLITVMFPACLWAQNTKSFILVASLKSLWGNAHLRNKGSSKKTDNGASNQPLSFTGGPSSPYMRKAS